MANELILERIAGWERQGLIDAPTGDRLRESERLLPPAAAPEWNATDPGRPQGGASRQGFGLSLDVGEAFAYLGSFFVLGAWYWFISQAARDMDRTDGIYAVGALVPAILFGGLGLVLDGLPGRVGRSAGLWSLLSGIHAFVGAPLVVAAVFPPETFSGGSLLGDYKLTFGGAVWLVLAFLYRTRIASIPTDLGLIGAILTLTSSAVDRIGHALAPPPYFFDGQPPDGAIWWMLTALSGTILATLAIGALAHAEDRSSRSDLAAGRRLAIARGAAGATLAIGTAIAMLAGLGGYDRPVEPAIGDVALLIAAIVLSGLALSRRAAAYIYPAGLAVLIAFTDLNGEYLASGVGVGPALLVEGIGLILVGFATQTGRRWINRREGMDDPADTERAIERLAGAALEQAAPVPRPTSESGPTRSRPSSS